MTFSYNFYNKINWHVVLQILNTVDINESQLRIKKKRQGLGGKKDENSAL